MGFYDAIRVGASGAVDSAFTVDRSLRFNRSDSAYLTRSQSSPTNAKKATVSTWLKRTDIGTNNAYFEIGYQSPYDRCTITIVDNTDGNKLGIFQRGSGGIACNVLTTQVFRDPSAWFHVVVAIDTTQSTASDRVKIYVNGTQITAFDSAVYFSQNDNITVGSGYTTHVGRFGNNQNYYGGYMAEVNFIDGQQLTPSSFAETNSDTGQWNPKKYVGSYGTNGFYLNFSDNSGTTATTLGKDSSGNGNNFTPNNFSVSAGDGNDSVTDTPTLNKATLNPLTGFTYNATLSEGNLKMSGSGGFKEISTIAVAGTSKLYYEVTPTSAAGWQILGVFVGQPNNPSNPLSNAAIYGFATTGNRYEGGSAVSGSPSWTTNDVMGVKYSNGTLQIYKNGTLYGTSITGISTSDIVFAYIANDNTNAAAFARFSSDSWTQASAAGVDATWELSSANLPDPTILLPNKHFDTLLYTGNGGTQSITGLDFQPDWVWMKARDFNSDNAVVDSVRGRSKIFYPSANQQENTSASDRDLVSFDSNGFTLGAHDHTSSTNKSGVSIVAWNWNAGDTDGKTYTVKVVSDGGNKYRFDDFGTSAVTLDLAEGGTYIFDGADSSMASHPIKLSETSNGTHGGGSSYNTGVTYLLDGASVTESAYVSGYASATTRQLKIVVAASAPTLYYYCHYHSGMGGQANTNSSLGSSNFDGSIQSTAKVNASAGFSITKYTGTGSDATVGHGLGVKPDCVIVKRRTGGTSDWFVFHKDIGNTKNLRLNLSNSQFTTANIWDNTDPTSSVVNIGFSSGVNGNGSTYVMYCFSEVAGYSKFGKYTGNGSSDGTFVFTGFRPAFVLIKSTNQNVGWYLLDNTRNTSNVVNKHLRADSSGVEQTDAFADFLANGFKHRYSDTSANGSGDSYVYLAFAESPFKNARAR